MSVTLSYVCPLCHRFALEDIRCDGEEEYRKVEEWRDTVVAVSRVSRMAAVGFRSSETEGDLLLSDTGARRKDTE